MIAPLREAHSGNRATRTEQNVFSPILLSVALGIIIILFGIAVITSPPGNEVQSVGGGIVFIGPVPIFFWGQGLVWLAIILALLLLIIYFSLRSLRVGRGFCRVRSPKFARED